MTTGQCRQEKLLREGGGPAPNDECATTSSGQDPLTGGQSEAAHARRDAFLAVAAHEIRNPLNALRWQLQLAFDSVNGRPDIPRDVLDNLILNLNRALTSTRNISRLIDDLGNLSFRSDGKLPIERQWLDLMAVIRETIQRTRNPAGDHASISFTGPETLFGRWDRMRVEQVISNLLENAVRFSKGRPIDVMVSAADALVQVQVRDRGAGIPAQELERIFCPFQSVDKTSRSHPGLGLWIVHQALFSMGGKITVSSKIGEGSSFVAELPRE